MAILHQSSATASVTGTSLAINKPTGTVAGDLLLAWLYKTDTPSAPAGWTFKADLGFGGGGGGGTLWYKIAGGSEPASYTFTQATSGKFAGGISRYSGVDNVTPFDTTVDYQAVGGGTSAAAGPVTTATANAMVIGGVANLNAPTVTPPGGLTERWEVAGVESASAIQTSAGSTGTETWTLSVSTTYAEVFVTALREGSPSQTIQLGFIASGEQVFTPALNQGAMIQLGFIPSAEQVFAPALVNTSGAQTIQLGFIPSAEQVFAPKISQAGSLAKVKASHQSAISVVVDHEPL